MAAAAVGGGNIAIDAAVKGETMDVSLILRVAGVGLLVAIAVQILQKNGRDEQANFVTVSGVIVVFLMLVQEIARLFETVRSLFGF